MTTSENESYQYYTAAMKVARDYGYYASHANDVIRARRWGQKQVFKYVNTPNPYKIPVLYIFDFSTKQWVYRTFLITVGENLENGFVGGVREDSFFEVVHSHAINRYIERSHFKGTREEACHQILTGLTLHSVAPEEIGNGGYIYFDGGVFITTWKDRVMHLRTFIMNRQCYPNQRLKSLKSEREVKEAREELAKIFGTDDPEKWPIKI